MNSMKSVRGSKGKRKMEWEGKAEKSKERGKKKGWVYARKADAIYSIELLLKVVSGICAHAALFTRIKFMVHR